MENVSFPAVTICYPNPAKWMGIARALDHFDSQGLIFDMIRNQSDRIHEMFKTSFTGPTETILNSFEPKLGIDHQLPIKIGFSIHETELFYLIHLATVEFLKVNWTWSDIDGFLRYDIFDLKFASFLQHKTRYQATQDIKKYICNIKGMDCTFAKDQSWFQCNETSTNGFSVYVNAN